MPVFAFNTIQAPSEGLFKDSGSRFLAFAYPVETEDEVKARLAILRKKYHDARHQGYAYILGAEQKLWRAFDDGEPNHSTGDPILGQIRSRKLTNVLVVVVRYFGGTKLGVSGLITAYRTAAATALDKAIVVEREVMTSLKLEFDFASTPEVMKLIKAFDLSIVSKEYSEKSRMVLNVPIRVAGQLNEKIALLIAKGSEIIIPPVTGHR